MECKRTGGGKQTRMPFKKLFVDPGSRWEALPFGVRSLASEAMRAADDDCLVASGAKPEDLMRHLRVHVSERRAFMVSLKKSVQLGVLSPDEDAQCWRINTPDLAISESLGKGANDVSRADGRQMVNRWSTDGLQMVVDKPLESLTRPLQDKEEDEDKDQDSEEKRNSTSNVSLTHTRSPNQLERARDPEPLRLVLSDCEPPGADPASPVRVSPLEQLVIDAWNEMIGEPRRAVRWNAHRLKWFRRVMAEEGHSAQEAVAIVLGWCYVPWVDASGAKNFTTVWSPKLASAREEAIALGTYNPAAETLYRMRELNGKPRSLVVGDPRGPERYRFGATEEQLGHVAQLFESEPGQWGPPTRPSGLLRRGEGDPFGDADGFQP